MTDTQTSDLPITGSVAITSIVMGENVRDVDSDHVASLAESIRLMGVLTPVVVTERDGKPHLVAGFHRLAAASAAGLEHIPVVWRDNEGTATDAAIENIHRKQLTPYEEAVALGRALEAGLTPEGAAQALGWTMNTVHRRSKLLIMPDVIAKWAGYSCFPLAAVDRMQQILDLHPDLPATLAGAVEKMNERDATQLIRDLANGWNAVHVVTDAIDGTPLAKKVRFIRMNESFTVRDIDNLKVRIGKEAKPVVDGILAGLKQDYEYGPAIYFTDEAVDGARALGALHEIASNRDEPMVVLVDDAKHSVLSTMCTVSLLAYTPPVKEKAERASKAAAERTPEKQLELDEKKELRGTLPEVAGAHAAQRAQLLEQFNSVPIDMDVARFFVYSVLGNDYAQHALTRGDGVTAWRNGIDGVLSPHWVPTPASSNGTARPDKIIYPSFDKNHGGEDEQLVKANAALWKYIDAAKTPEELFGRALAVLAGPSLGMTDALPASRNWDTLYGVYRAELGSVKYTHKDAARKAMMALLKKHKVISPRMEAAAKSKKSIRSRFVRKAKDISTTKEA